MYIRIHIYIYIWQTETRRREAFFQPSILWQESRLKYPNQAGMLFLNRRTEAPRCSRLKYKHYDRLISTVAPSDKTSITTSALGHQAHRLIRLHTTSWETSLLRHWLYKCRRTGHPISFRALAQAIFVDAIFAVNNSSNALVISSGGPDSMISLSGRPWPSKLLKHVGRDKLTYVANHFDGFESFAGKV